MRYPPRHHLPNYQNYLLLERAQDLVLPKRPANRWQGELTKLGWMQVCTLSNICSTWGGDHSPAVAHSNQWGEKSWCQLDQVTSLTILAFLNTYCIIGILRCRIDLCCKFLKILRSELDYRWILDGRQLFTDSCPLVTLEFHLLVFTGCPHEIL